MSKRGNGEGTISRRKDGTFFARYWVDTPTGRTRKTIYGKKGETRAGVAKRLAKAIADRDRGLVFDDQALKVGEYLLPHAARHGLRSRRRDGSGSRGRAGLGSLAGWCGGWCG